MNTAGGGELLGVGKKTHTLATGIIRVILGDAEKGPRGEDGERR